MHPKIKAEYFEPAFLLSASFAWLISSTILLVIGAIILKESYANERVMAYVSSSISFLSAMTAGSVAKQKGRAGGFYIAMLTATFLVVALLTIGFLIDGSRIEPSSVMSVISFTFSGCLVGTIFNHKSENKKKQYRARM